MSLSDHFERKSRTNDLFQYVFSSVAGKKGHVVIDDVIQWDFTQVTPSHSSSFCTLPSAAVVVIITVEKNDKYSCIFIFITTSVESFILVLRLYTLSPLFTFILISILPV